MDKATIFATFGKICPTPAEAHAALAVVYDAVAVYPEAMQAELLPDYFEGYKNWLLAGLKPMHDGEALRRVGNGAPNVWNAFMLAIEGALPMPRHLTRASFGLN